MIAGGALERSAELLDEVVRVIDSGQVQATSAERAYLVAAARTQREVAVHAA